MTPDPLSLEEYQHLMIMLNSRHDIENEMSCNLSKKLEKIISNMREHTTVEQRTLGGVPVTITRTKI